MPSTTSSGVTYTRRSASFVFAIGLAAATAATPSVASAETAFTPAKAQEWMADKQRNETAMVQRLKAKFNESPTIKTGIRDFARKLLDEIKVDVVAGDENAISAVNQIGIRGLSITAKPGVEPQAIALAKINGLLAQETLPVQVLGDIMWMSNFAIASQRNARRNQVFAHIQGIGDVDVDTVWAEKLSDSPIGRHRVTRGDEIAALKANNDATDAGGLHAELTASCAGCALKRTAMRPTSVVLRIEKALGLMVGADLSGTTNVFTWQLEHEGFTDPLWKLIPIVTMVADGDHTLLEVALVLHSHGYIKYKIGDYRTLLPATSTHPAAAEVRAILAEASAGPASAPMYCWYGKTNQVAGCRRSGGDETIKPLNADEVYNYFAAATADAPAPAVASRDNVLNEFGFLKSEPPGFPFSPAAISVSADALLGSGDSATGPETCDYRLVVNRSTVNHTMPCKLKAVKIDANTVFYKGSYRGTRPWRIEGGYVSHIAGATAYARAIMSNVEPGQDPPNVTLYSAKAAGDLYLIDIRDLPTLKALFSLPGGMAGFSDLTALAPKLTYEGSGEPFDSNQINSLFGFAVDERGLERAIRTKCNASMSCAAREFEKVKIADNAYTRYVKTLADVVAAPGEELEGHRLYRFSVFLRNSETHKRIVPDTVITDKLCPYLAALGFAGWYGGNNIPVNPRSNLIEENYICWDQSSLKDQAQNDDSALWPTLPATKAPGPPTEYFPKGIIKIPSGPTGKTLAGTSAVGTAHP